MTHASNETASSQTPPVTTPPAEPSSLVIVPASMWLMKYADAKQLSKPRITRMVLITTFIGFVMAQRTVFGQMYGATHMINTLQHSWLLLLNTLIGTGLSCMGASALNQLYEHETDGMMHRTQNRPLPSGRVSKVSATILGLTMSIAGVLILAFLVNMLTAAISAFTIFSYVLIYTPMKRVNSLSTIVGAVPGALPPVMGFTAVANYVGIEAALLFGILFLWQLPHFLAIAWLYREDYARAKMPMLPVVDPDGTSTFMQILIGCAVLVPLGMLPTYFNVSGMIYFVVSTLCGLGFLGFGVALVIGRTRKHARAMFFASLAYLPLVLGLMMLDQR